MKTLIYGIIFTALVICLSFLINFKPSDKTVGVEDKAEKVKINEISRE